MSLRIIGGKFRGRSLKTPSGSTTRPTQSIVREAVFNICQQQIEGAAFLDCFAGSGAMGFEALSRGASHVTFIEQDKRALHAIRENTVLLHVADTTTLLPYRADLALKKLTTPFDLIYLDPPYDLPLAPIVEEILQKALLAKEGLLFTEERADKKTKPPQFAGLTLVSSRTFGEATIHLFRI